MGLRPAFLRLLEAKKSKGPSWPMPGPMVFEAETKATK